MSYLSENNIKGVCFDIDGTFYPAKQTNKYLLKSAIKAPIFSIKYCSMRKKMREIDALDSKDVISLEDFRKKEATLMKYSYEKYISKYNQMYSSWQETSKIMKLFDGVKDVLDYLKQEGLILSCLSDFPIGNKIEVLGLKEYFAFYTSCEEYGYLKPNKTSFDEVAKRMNLNNNEILYVGNSYSKDIVGSNNAKMHSVYIPNLKGEESLDLSFSTWKEFYSFLIGGNNV